MRLGILQSGWLRPERLNSEQLRATQQTQQQADSAAEEAAETALYE